MGTFYILLIAIIVLTVAFVLAIEQNEGGAGFVLLFLASAIISLCVYSSDYFYMTFSNAKVVKMQNICEKFGGLSEFDVSEFKCNDGTIIKIDSIKLDPEAP